MERKLQKSRLQNTAKPLPSEQNQLFQMLFHVLVWQWYKLRYFLHTMNSVRAATVDFGCISV